MGVDGITVNGVPLVEYVRKVEDVAKTSEIEKVRRQELARGVHVSRRARLGVEETRRVSKRARRLTPDEIRKEYGVMAKPGRTRNENVIAAIVASGPINAMDIGKLVEFDGPYSSLTALVSVVWRHLGSDGAGMLLRDKQGTAFVYRCAPGVTTEAALEEYKKRSGVWAAERVKSQPRRRAATPDTPIDEGGVEATVREAIERVLGINFGGTVNVTGRIDVVFRIER